MQTAASSIAGALLNGFIDTTNEVSYFVVVGFEIVIVGIVGQPLKEIFVALVLMADADVNVNEKR